MMRVGRWLRAQGAPRPTKLQRAEDGLIIVDGQILMIDSFGHIQNMSTARRADARFGGPHTRGPYR
jgi:hypothetical protein